MRSLFLFCLTIFTLNVGAQTFLGAHTSTYDPIKASYFNPASPATSLMKWEVSVIGIDIHAAQNYIKLKGGIRDWIDNFDKDIHLEENLNGMDKSGNISADIPSLGFVFNHEKIGAISFGLRGRVLVDVDGVEEEFITSILNNANNIYNWESLINDTEMSVNAHAFSEIAFGYSRYFLKKEKHALSAGASMKLMVPAFSGKLNGNVDITIDQTAETGNFGTTNLSAISSDILNLVDDEFYEYKAGIAGFGLDFGAVYEYKTGFGTTKVIGKNKNKVKLQPDYFIKAGFAILDLGRIKYQHSDYSRTFKGDGSTVPLSAITESDSAFIDFDQVLNAVGSFESFSGDFKTKLPTTMSLFVDVKLTRGIYVNASALISMGKFSQDSPKANSQTIVSLTPRFELPMVGVYMPMAYNTNNGFEMGASFRFSQFVIGSSNIFSYLWSKEASSIDIQFAVAFGGVDKSKKNAVKELIDDDEMLLEE